MNQNMYEIILNHGLGEIEFGSKPSEVKSKLGNDLYYEDWMGGNLENFLFYKGLLIGFRGKITEHPTENSTLCMFQVKTVHPLSLWGQEITRASKTDIEDLLSSNKMKYRTLSNGILQSKDREIQFTFKGSGNLDEVYFAKSNS